MGCVTSKVMTKTGSFHEQVINRSLRRRDKGFPGIENLLFVSTSSSSSSSRNASDQGFLLVCTTAAAAGKQPPTKVPSELLESSSTNTTSSKQSLLLLEEEEDGDGDGDDYRALNNPETINTWDLMAGLDEQQPQQEEDLDDDAKTYGVPYKWKHQFPTSAAAEGSSGTRCQSFHLSSSDYYESSSSSSSVQTTDIIVRSKSLHTLHLDLDLDDEYNAILLLKPKTDWDLSYNTTMLFSDNPCHRQVAIPKVIQQQQQEEEEEEGKTHHQVQVIGATPTTRTSSIIIGSSCTSGADIKANAEEEEEEEKGARRKARAKDLTSLAIPPWPSSPSTIEFPVFVADYMEANKEKPLLQHHCSSPYVTPKFGSFVMPVFYTNNNNKSSIEEEEEDKVYLFDPEMISSFELAMIQLQVEQEEFLLKQMLESS